MTQPRGSAGPGPSLILASVLGPFALYLVTAPWLARLAGQTAWAAPVWSAQLEYPAWSRPLVLLFGLSGVAIALLVPALAWARVLAGGPLRAASLYHRAFALNLIQATIFLGAWKAFAGVVPSRPIFIGWQGLVAGAGLVALLRSRQRTAARPPDRVRPLLAGVVVLLVLLPGFLWDKTFVENGSGDGTEAYEFSRCLATHQLPHWDLENGYYGFYPSFMLFAYPAQQSFIALGESEAAQRIPVYFYLLGIYLVLVELVRRGNRRMPWSELSLLAGATLLAFVYHAHHSTYELVSDLAEPTGVDVFFTFLAASALYALTTRQRGWWALFALFGTMALAAGMPFALLFLLGRARMTTRASWPRRPALRDALAFFLPWLAYKGFVFVYARLHPLGTTKWDLGNLLEQYPLKPGPAVAAALAINFMLVIALVPIASLSLFARRDRIARTLGVTVIGYLFILFLFGRTHPHYLIPLSFFPAAMLLRWRRDARLQFSYGTLLVVITIAVLPPDRAAHTAYRRFGAHTLMLYDSYPAAVDAAERLLERAPDLFVNLPNGFSSLPWQRTELILAEETPPVERALDEVFRKLRSNDGSLRAPWGLSHHVWIRYSDRTPRPGREYQQVLASPQLAPPQLDGFTRRELEKGWVLFSRSEGLAFAH